MAKKQNFLLVKGTDAISRRPDGYPTEVAFVLQKPPGIVLGDRTSFLEKDWNRELNVSFKDNYRMMKKLDGPGALEEDKKQAEWVARFLEELDLSETPQKPSGNQTKGKLAKETWKGQ